MKILITGAHGYVGRALCGALLAAGEQVVAMWHRNGDALPGAFGGDLTAVQGDIRDAQSLSRLCRGVDAVCHLAVLPPGAPAAAKTNVHGTHNVVEACLLQGVGRLVYASSMSVYDFQAPEYLPVDEAHPLGPLQEYGREKLQGEEACLRGGRDGALGVCALRLSGIFGPGKTQGAAYAFARAIMADEVVQIEADRTVDLLYLDDAVQALQRALSRPCEGVYNIGSGQGVALSDLAAKIGGRLDRKPRIEREREGNAFVLDIARARADLGYEPMGLDAALDRFVPWVLRHAAD